MGAAFGAPNACTAYGGVALDCLIPSVLKYLRRRGIYFPIEPQEGDIGPTWPDVTSPAACFSFQE